MCKHAYKFRLYPTRKQEQLLTWTLDRARELYNAALQERKDASRMAGKTINYYDQANQLPEIKEMRQEYQHIHSQVLQDVLRRVDKAIKAFFRRVKAGEKPGYPRFQGRNRYDSFCYPQGGYSLTADNRICLSKIGSIKLKLHRQIKGTIKTATIKREGDCWFIIFACEVEDSPKLACTGEAVGIDLGLTHFATLSTGDTIDNPRYFRQSEKKLARAQQKLSRKKKGSKRREKAAKLLGKLHRKVRRQRQDFLHKQSRQLVDTYETIVFEDLQPTNLFRQPKPKQDENGTYLPNGASAKGGLNKSINDAGWSQFQQYCTYKAANAGREVLFVHPRYTSQICSGCGTVKKKDLSERWHSCECGTELDRDHNAAINILRLGQSLQGTRP
ncbi:MAG TPA: transposase [Ktedonobacteraceae bacterium]|nr:transposase [Ktedonobacteraceae bacterium]